MGYDERTSALPFDILGIGIGPSNLGLAALTSSETSTRTLFLERAPQLSWHDGLMVPNAEMQTSFLEDLVTPVDPTNRFSFLSYLSQNDLMSMFLCRTLTSISRHEFRAYLKWVARNLDSLRFSSEVIEVNHDNGKFQVRTDLDVFHAAHLSVAIGKEPRVPPWAKNHVGRDVSHASDFLRHSSEIAGEHVLVVGGGQSAADVVLSILHNASELPKSLVWVTRRMSLIALDNSPFVNELHTPQYRDFFYQLSRPIRQSQLHDQTFAADGILPSTLEQLYEAFYRFSYIESGAPSLQIYPAAEVVGLRRAGSDLTALMENRLTNSVSEVGVTKIILATGYVDRFPEFLEPLKNDLILSSDNQALTHDDYSAKHNGRLGQNKIFFQNAGKEQFGVGDAQLCMTSWRNAAIINSILRCNRYRAHPKATFIEWSGPKLCSGDPNVQEERFERTS